MSIQPLHENQFRIDDAMVRRLIHTQCPQWAHLPIKPFQSSGSDNFIYRLGADRVIRLPMTPDAAMRVQKEQHCLPELAPHLPLPIPVPLFAGQASADYPANWSVFSWLPGEAANAPGQILDEMHIAEQLAEFILTLQQQPSADGPTPGKHNFFRGVPLAARDSEVQTALQALSSSMDTQAAAASWEALKSTPSWQGTPRWIHGDLIPGNILVEHGRISAVIDFGGAAVGDPACDLISAWALFSQAARSHFKAKLGMDEASWRRGMGWALSIGLIALPYYRDSNPPLANIAEQMIQHTLVEC